MNRKSLWTACVVLLVLGTAHTATAQACPSDMQKVAIDHLSGTVNPDGVLQLKKGEEFCILVTRTDLNCFLVNLEDRQPGIEFMSSGRQVTQTSTTSTHFVVKHDGVTDAYLVSLDPKTTTCASGGLQKLERQIRVENFGWMLAVTGAFTIDELTDPKYYLEDRDEGGFIVRRREAADDDHRLGAGTFLHLYKNDPDGRWLWWAPVSFGLGIHEGSELTYLVGTSLRFGNRAYLTGGLAFGSQDRLPSGLGVDEVTDAANALDSLPSRTDTAAFFAFSFSGLDIDVSRLSQAFKAKVPAAK